MTHNDALRGYAFPIHQRDGFRCVYCGFDGRAWPNWLFLSQDHLLPDGDPRRERREYIVTACRFCNEAHNRTSFDVQGKSREDIVSSKRSAIIERRAAYLAFWMKNVCLEAAARELGPK